MLTPEMVLTPEMMLSEMHLKCPKKPRRPEALYRQK